MNSRPTAYCLAMTGGLFAALPVSARDIFPKRPIRMIVPASPGGGSDIMGRQIAAILSANIGQPLVPENRPGATGLVGPTAAAADSVFQDFQQDQT